MYQVTIFVKMTIESRPCSLIVKWSVTADFLNSSQNYKIIISPLNKDHQVFITVPYHVHFSSHTCMGCPIRI